MAMSMQTERMLLVATTTAAMLAIAACDDSPLLGGESGVYRLIQTDQTGYELREGRAEGDLEGEIPFACRNFTGKIVCLDGCLPVHPQKRVAGEWVPTWSAFTVNRPMIVVAPGATYRDTMRIHHYGAGLAFPRLVAEEIDGTYRLPAPSALHDDDTEKGEGKPLPLKYRMSNGFVLRAP